MAGIVSYVKESFEELRTNVTWTPWAEAQRLTIVVAVFSIIFSLAIWGVDEAFAWLLSSIYKLVLGI
ncbi:preprotein translocase subunit SecE [Kordia periserrulae]|uniref:Protein translocase subunit SecE n=1 Tax=Kordia periserrulae TaxID=701523 RepID=A0A2T6C534_9FLAO|nr:preprotein translocase subunit SecE [Kordia periserrulae]PTX63416.1 preprotein translocase subunit SecE [Kordia periserrulae]